MRVLLTGSSGWLGRFLAPELRRNGHHVIGLDVAPGAETNVIASVANRGDVEQVFADQGIEAVVHAGALHKPDIVRFPAKCFVDVNVSGTLALLETAVAAGHDRFVFTSTTSVMITQEIRDENPSAAIWLDEEFGPLAPRNIYGVTKLAAEHLCRMHFLTHGLKCVVLRIGRFFPEDDDMITEISGENLKANEFLFRRLTVQDAARAHVAALESAPTLGFGIFVISAPTPFARRDVAELSTDASAVVARIYPNVRDLYRWKRWSLPRTISRVYDASLAKRQMGFVCQTDFAAILAALERDTELPFVHDPAFVSPVAGACAIPAASTSSML